MPQLALKPQLPHRSGVITFDFGRCNSSSFWGWARRHGVVALRSPVRGLPPTVRWTVNLNTPHMVEKKVLYKSMRTEYKRGDKPGWIVYSGWLSLTWPTVCVLSSLRLRCSNVIDRFYFFSLHISQFRPDQQNYFLKAQEQKLNVFVQNAPSPRNQRRRSVAKGGQRVRGGGLRHGTAGCVPGELSTRHTTPTCQSTLVVSAVVPPSNSVDQLLQAGRECEMVDCRTQLSIIFLRSHIMLQSSLSYNFSGKYWLYTIKRVC